jgi:hypothetical protein
LFWLRAMPKNCVLCGIALSSDSALCQIVLSFLKKFYLWLVAMPLSVKFKSEIFLPTLRYAAQWGVDSELCRIAPSSDSALCRIAWSLKKKFYLWLPAMPLSVKFKSKIFLPTPRYVAQRGVDSTLCCIAGSRLHAMLHSGELWLRAMLHIT